MPATAGRPSPPLSPPRDAAPIAPDDPPPVAFAVVEAEEVEGERVAVEAGEVEGEGEVVVVEGVAVARWMVGTSVTIRAADVVVLGLRDVAI